MVYKKKDVIKLLQYRMHDIQNQPERQIDKDNVLRHIQYAIDLIIDLDPNNGENQMKSDGKHDDAVDALCHMVTEVWKSDKSQRINLNGYMGFDWETDRDV